MFPNTTLTTKVYTISAIIIDKGRLLKKQPPFIHIVIGFMRRYWRM